MLVRWGLIPTWVKDTREFPLLFNARSEGAIEKASFKAAMRHRRALVPASGFYEWRQTAGKKGQPYWIRPRHGGLVAFAGLIETYADEWGDAYTGVMVDATEELLDIHDRMPVILRPEDHATLAAIAAPRSRAMFVDLMRPADEDYFEAIPVSDLVNKVANVRPGDSGEGRDRAGAREGQAPEARRGRQSDDAVLEHDPEKWPRFSGKIKLRQKDRSCYLEA